MPTCKNSTHHTWPVWTCYMLKSLFRSLVTALLNAIDFFFTIFIMDSTN